MARSYIIILLLLVGACVGALIDTSNWLNDDFSTFWKTEESTVEVVEGDLQYTVDFELLDSCNSCLEDPNKVITI